MAKRRAASRCRCSSPAPSSGTWPGSAARPAGSRARYRSPWPLRSSAGATGRTASPTCAPGAIACTRGRVCARVWPRCAGPARPTCGRMRPSAAQAGGCATTRQASASAGATVLAGLVSTTSAPLVTISTTSASSLRNHCGFTPASERTGLRGARAGLRRVARAPEHRTATPPEWPGSGHRRVPSFRSGSRRQRRSSRWRSTAPS